MATLRKGLREIHTLSGRQDHVYRPYRAYMQITCLEMEKARRRSERKTALQRISNLDARLEEIETQKAALLGLIEERNAGNGGKSTGDTILEPNAPAIRGATKLSPRRTVGALRLRY